MKTFIFDQLLTLKRLRAKIERNEITNTGYILPGLTVIVLILLATTSLFADGSSPTMQTYHLVLNVVAALLDILCLYVGFKLIGKTFSWKITGIVAYALTWRMLVIGWIILSLTTIVSLILTGEMLDWPTTLTATPELLSYEALIAGIIGLLIPSSLAFLYGSNNSDGPN